MAVIRLEPDVHEHGVSALCALAKIRVLLIGSQSLNKPYRCLAFANTDVPSETVAC